jgi:hypothetical protein
LISALSGSGSERVHVGDIVDSLLVHRSLAELLTNAAS